MRPTFSVRRTNFLRAGLPYDGTPALGAETRTRVATFDPAPGPLVLFHGVSQSIIAWIPFLLFSRGQRHWRGSRSSGYAPRSQQQPEREEVHPEKRWHIKHGDRVTGPELPGN